MRACVCIHIKQKHLLPM